MDEYFIPDIGKLINSYLDYKTNAFDKYLAINDIILTVQQFKTLKYQNFFAITLNEDTISGIMQLFKLIEPFTFADFKYVNDKINKKYFHSSDALFIFSLNNNELNKFFTKLTNEYIVATIFTNIKFGPTYCRELAICFEKRNNCVEVSFNKRKLDGEFSCFNEAFLEVYNYVLSIIIP